MRAGYWSLALLCACSGAQIAVGPDIETLLAMSGLSVPRESRQVILVTAPSWNSSRGELRRFERDMNGRLLQVGQTVAVNLGRNGLGWGRGISGGPRGADPIKKEGDGRSPAGVFELGTAFGYSSAPPERSLWPWRQLGPLDRWVTDPLSALYNTLQKAPETGNPPWNAAEVMRRPDGIYEVGIVIRHNDAPVVSGAGSATFFHVEVAAGHPTEGGVSMPRHALVEIIRWLDPNSHPIVVLVPGH